MVNKTRVQCLNHSLRRREEIRWPYLQLGQQQPKIGPPVVTGGASCVATVFEKGEGCQCPRGMQRDEIGDPNKIGAEHVMVWCRRKPGARM